jgi:hypothetical protein
MFSDKISYKVQLTQYIVTYEKFRRIHILFKCFKHLFVSWVQLLKSKWIIFFNPTKQTELKFKNFNTGNHYIIINKHAIQQTPLRNRHGPWGFSGAVVKASAFHLRDCGFDSLVAHSCELRVSQRSAESHGFSPGAPVSSHREH